MSEPAAGRHPLFARTPPIAGGVVAGVGAVVLVGWLGGLPWLRVELPGLTPVPPVTAVLLLLGGLALVGRTGGDAPRRAAGLAAAVLAAGWGLVTAAELAAGGGPLSAALAGWAGVASAQPASGWSAAQSAALGLAVLTLPARRFARAAELFVLVPLAITFLGLVAVAFRAVAPDGGWATALPTIAPNLVFEIGLLAARPDRGVMAVLTARDLGGALARRLLPVAVLVPFAIGWALAAGGAAGLVGREVGAAAYSLTLVFVQAALVLWYAAAVGRADRRRRAAEQALRDADRRKDEFLATLAHELRNPLAPVRNGLEILRVAGLAGGPAAKTVAMMDRQLRHLVVLIDDLLDVSRITRGKIALRVEPVELAAVVAHAVEAAAPLVERNGHALAGVPTDAPVALVGDFTRLAQVFANLLTNSAKYTPAGGRITLTARADGGQVVVAVADTGIGIPPAALGRVFDLFAQVDRTTEKTSGGLGIGLALVKGLAELHGGTVTAFSEGEGKGSTFTVRLPAGGPRGGRPAAAVLDRPQEPDPAEPVSADPGR